MVSLITCNECHCHCYAFFLSPFYLSPVSHQLGRNLISTRALRSTAAITGGKARIKTRTTGSPLRSIPLSPHHSLSTTGFSTTTSTRAALSFPKSNNNHPYVIINAPTIDSRQITCTIHISAPPSLVYSVLADYSNLANIVPNLASSRILGKRPHDKAVILEQRGVQKILGFEFAASVILVMKEIQGEVIEFDLLESRDFRSFWGKWVIAGIREEKNDLETLGGIGIEVPLGTELTYEVTVAPRGLVPVKAIEWRIGEDVPGNLRALKMHCELMKWKEKRKSRLGNRNGVGFR